MAVQSTGLTSRDSTYVLYSKVGGEWAFFACVSTEHTFATQPDGLGRLGVPWRAACWSDVVAELMMHFCFFKAARLHAMHVYSTIIQYCCMHVVNVAYAWGGITGDMFGLGLLG